MSAAERTWSLGRDASGRVMQFRRTRDGITLCRQAGAGLPGCSIDLTKDQLRDIAAVVNG